ncbi:hypothetical protein VTP21DRAFT_804 [Calcarisporiella thermophila]
MPHKLFVLLTTIRTSQFSAARIPSAL